MRCHHRLAAAATAETKHWQAASTSLLQPPKQPALEPLLGLNLAPNYVQGQPPHLEQITLAKDSQDQLQLSSLRSFLA